MRKKISRIITHPLFSGSAVMIIGSNSVSFINYVYHLIVGRMLGPNNYGELAALISLIGLLGIVPSSFNLVVIKYISIAKDKVEVASLVRWFKRKIFLISLIFFFLILIASPAIAAFLHISNISYLIIIALFFLFSLHALLNRSILQGLLKFKEMVLSLMIENGTKVVVSIVLIYLGFQVNGALVSILIAIILGWYVTTIYLRKNAKQDKHVEIKYKRMLLFTLPVLIQAISTTSIFSSDVILVKHFFSSHEAGLYASLSTLGKIILFGAGPIGSVMFPLISKRHAVGKPYRRIFIYSFLATVLLSLGVLSIYFWAPQLAINLLYGSAYLEASNLLIWFGYFMSLFTLASLLIYFNLSLGRTKVVLLPLSAAILQIIMILLFHQTLFMVILISTIVSALLLVSLLIYSTYGKRLFI